MPPSSIESKTDDKTDKDTTQNNHRQHPTDKQRSNPRGTRSGPTAKRCKEAWGTKAKKPHNPIEKMACLALPPKAANPKKHYFP